MTVITIDNDRAEIRNAAIVEVGYRADSRRPPTAELAQSYLNGANFAPQASASSVRPDSPLVKAMTEGAKTHPDRVDDFLGLFFGGGCRDHIDGLHCPFVRIGHPAPGDELRVDLANTAGVVVGVIRRAWMDGPQLRGDIVFLENPPIPDWRDGVLPALLGLAADRPAECLGLSVCPLPPSGDGDEVLPVAVDLVNRPACNRNGLLGLPSNGAAAHPRSPVREVGRRRAYHSDLGQQVGQLVYESLLKAWLQGKEPV